ncbi:MAG: FecR domain-containing protein [Bacteroidales bacterium]|nr:FecR domain-containing protein [Bacteroidales bacterium]
MEELNDKNLEFVLKHYKEGALDTERALRKVRARAGKSSFSWRMLSSVAAAVILVAGLLIWNDQRSYSTLSALNGNAEYTLPDHSVVTLYEGSSLKFKPQAMISGKNRKVKLSGKAFFEVERDEARPFEISSKEGFVRVLGTKFQVDSDSKEVYVESGKVLFAKASKLEGVILTAGMKAIIFENDDIPTIVESTTGNEIAWKRGTFVYDDQPLSIILDEIKAYYGKNLVIRTKGKDLSTLRMTGEFDIESPEDVLDALSSAFDIDVKFKK